MKLYAASVMASRVVDGRVQVNNQSYAFNAEPETVEEVSNPLALALFPESEGWEDRLVSIVQISDGMIERAGWTRKHDNPLSSLPFHYEKE